MHLQLLHKIVYCQIISIQNETPYFNNGLVLTLYRSGPFFDAI